MTDKNLSELISSSYNGVNLIDDTANTITNVWSGFKISNELNSIVIPDTDLSLLANGSAIELQSSTGNNVTIFSANSTTAGLLSAEAQTIAGDKTFTGTITYSSTLDSNLIPDLDITYDLGSANNRWRDLYLSGNTINLGDAQIKADEATGTIALIPPVTASNPHPKAMVLNSRGRMQMLNTAAGVLSSQAVEETANTEDNVFESVTVTGHVNANTFIGDGSAVTNVDAVTLQGNTVADLRQYADNAAANVSVDLTAPQNPDNGNLWLNTSSGYLYVYVNDGDSEQWIQPAVPTSGLPTLSAVAISGNYTDLTNTPTIPTLLTDLGIADGTVGQILTTDGVGGFTFEDTDSNSIGNFTFISSTIDTADQSSIQFVPAISMTSDLTLETELVFSDGSRQSTAALEGPQGPEGPPGPTGAGAGDVSSVGDEYVDNAVVRYSGTSGTSVQTSLASISDTGTLTAVAFSGAGASLTALNASNLSSGTVPDARFPSTLPVISGVNLTALNASNLSSGTMPDARFPSTLPVISGVNLTALNASNLTSGIVPDDRFPSTLPVISGVNLTALNASNLSSGTVPNARFPATLPAISGVNLTALNASNLTSGTVPIARLGASGVRNATTFLRGDNTFAVIPSGDGTTSNSFASVAVSGQSDVVAESATDTLTLIAGANITITTDAANDAITIAAAAAAPGTTSNSFVSVAVSGQSDVVAESATDALTLIAGTGIAITTDAANDAITIAADAVPVSNSFVSVAVSGQNSVVADSATDTLTLIAGTGIAITTDAATDAVTVTSTVSGGATAFTGLSDRSDLTVDRFYLSAITMLNTVSNGFSSYRFDQYGTVDNPTVYAISGTTIAFNLDASGHPFLVQTSDGTNYNVGLVHVTPSGTVTTGASAQGKTSGTLYWKIPSTTTGNYRYICQFHGNMVGTITIKDIANI